MENQSYTDKELRELTQAAIKSGKVDALIKIFDTLIAIEKKLSKGLAAKGAPNDLIQDSEKHIKRLEKLKGEILKAEQKKGELQHFRTPTFVDTTMTKGRQLSLLEIFDTDEAFNNSEWTIDKKKTFCEWETDPDGWEVALVIQALLHLHSANTTDPSAPDFYAGDSVEGVNKLVAWRGGTAEGRLLKTSIAEVTRLRTGEDKPTKWDRERTAKMLQKFNAKPYYMQVTVNEAKEKGSKRGKSYTYSTMEILYKAEFLRDNRTGKTDILLTIKPFFFEGIDTHYNLRPIDYIPRVKAAYQKAIKNKNKRSVPVSLHTFLSNLIQSTGNASQSYNVDLKKLYLLLDDYAVNNRQWGVLEETLATYCDVAKEIGLLTDWDIRPSERNPAEKVAVFHVAGDSEWNPRKDKKGVRLARKRGKKG